MTTNENISMGDIIDLHGMHDQKKAGNTVSTVLGIVGAIIVIAILWFAFVRRGDFGKTTEKETNVNLGENNGAISELRSQMRGLVEHERQDALRIAHTDGRLQPYHFAHSGGGFQPAFGGLYLPPFDGRLPYAGNYYGNGEHGRCGRHGDEHCGAKFQEVKTFTPTTDVVTLTSNCNCG